MFHQKFPSIAPTLVFVGNIFIGYFNHGTWRMTGGKNVKNL
jgi:hypothetical protein